MALRAVVAVVAVCVCACSAGDRLSGDERTCDAIGELVESLGGNAGVEATQAAIGTFREAAADANEGDLRQASQGVFSASDRYLADPSSPDARTELATAIFSVTETCDVIGH